MKIIMVRIRCCMSSIHLSEMNVVPSQHLLKCILISWVCSWRDSSFEAGTYCSVQGLDPGTSSPGARGLKQSSLTLTPLKAKILQGGKNCKTSCCSVTKSCLTLCNPMACNTPGFTVALHLPEFAQVHVYWIMMPSNHLILCCPLLRLPSIFPTWGSFPMSWLFTSGGQSIRVSTSVSVLPKSI